MKKTQKTDAKKSKTNAVNPKAGQKAGGSSMSRNEQSDFSRDKDSRRDSEDLSSN
jgi:hypothetical protein